MIGRRELAKRVKLRKELHKLKKDEKKHEEWVRVGESDVRAESGWSDTSGLADSAEWLAADARRLEEIRERMEEIQDALAIPYHKR